MTSAKKLTPAKELKVNEKKWTKPLMNAGFTVLPNVIIERQKALGLDPTDLNILLHLACRWWSADNPPFPAVKTIADAMGLKRSAVQKRIASLEKEGLLEREERYHPERGQQSNIYHLDGLIEAATPLAEEEIDARQATKEERRGRGKRKKPIKRKLSVVKKR